jgi:3-keto-5-aminohexanoate cleavage enzyme
MELTPFALSLCPTGMVPRRADSPHVPLTPAEIADDVLSCYEVGITSVHLHARDQNGVPTWEPDYYADIIGRIRPYAPDLVVCVTTSGRLESDVAKRAAVLDLDGDLKPDMASLTLSSMNFSKEASVNSPETVQTLAGLMRDRGITPELEVFDTGMLNYAHYLIGKKLLRPPYVVNLLLGGVASAQATPLDLGSMLARLPQPAMWLVAGIGTTQLDANVLGLASGGGVRVGLEDNLHRDRGRKTLATNRVLVERIHRIAGELERPIMSGRHFRDWLAT